MDNIFDGFGKKSDAEIIGADNEVTKLQKQIAEMKEKQAFMDRLHKRFGANLTEEHERFYTEILKAEDAQLERQKQRKVYEAEQKVKVEADKIAYFSQMSKSGKVVTYLNGKRIATEPGLILNCPHCGKVHNATYDLHNTFWQLHIEGLAAGSDWYAGAIPVCNTECGWCHKNAQFTVLVVP